MSFLFQSPRSGKFVSNKNGAKAVIFRPGIKFQSPRSGKFVSNEKNEPMFIDLELWGFQSPRSGKFVSDDYSVYCENKRESPIVF